MQDILNAISSFWNDGIVPILSFIWEGLTTVIKYIADIKTLINPIYAFINIIFGGMAPSMMAFCVFVLGFCLATLVVRLLR